MEEKVLYSERTIDFNSLPINALDEALGSITSNQLMQKCLRMLIQKGIKFCGCDYDDNIGIAFIAFEEQEDVICYLSNELREDDRVELNTEDGRQVVVFKGKPEDLSGLIIKFMQDVLKGKIHIPEEYVEGEPDGWCRPLIGDNTWGDVVEIKSRCQRRTIGTAYRRQ